MGLWKTLTAVITLSISADAMAWYVENPVERALSATTLVPTMILGGTTAFTVYGPSMMKKAKSDALAFVGSDGEIRGAQFEQASLHYRSAPHTRPMTDMQLAQAIATTY